MKKNFNMTGKNTSPMQEQMSDRDYAMEEAEDYFHDEYDPTEEAYGQYEYHVGMLEKHPIRYRIELFIQDVQYQWNCSSWRRWAYRSIPWLRNKKYEEELPF